MQYGTQPPFFLKIGERVEFRIDQYVSSLCHATRLYSA
jgi:hypothetical protein